MTERQITSNYEDTLRAIGQGLENLGAIAFELENSEGEFIVSGECRKTAAATTPIRKKLFLSLVQNIGATKRKPGSQTFHFSGLRFGQSDIDLLNRKGRALRSGSGNPTPNPDKLSHVLRMTGTYLDRTESQLAKVSWRFPILTLWQITKFGNETKRVFTLPEMYDVWVRQFKKRTPLHPLKSTGSG